jgi:TNF receptor-associated protein 1
MSENTMEQHTFQAEVGQLLDIVTHSLYTDREIFLRELVSNAADALEKLRHFQLTEKEVFDADLPLEINITSDDAAGTITLQDFGLGMTREELVENLGTIAHSGSRAFVEALKKVNESGATSSEASQNLIGQFGVGFYSAYMVASEVKVYTHSWKNDGEHLCWTSDGKTGYTIEETPGQRRGAKIVLRLKEDAKDFAKADRIKGILRRYSAFVPFPINVNGEKINTVQALWQRSKNEITPEEYKEFYKFQANAFDEPLDWLHFSADAPLAINALLFTPTENMERFGFGRMEPGVALYCRKVLIDPNPEKLLPEWLRFLRGVVDSADLPLNISRESMQDSDLVRKLGKVITNRVIKSFEELARKNPETFEKFYTGFHLFIKEGVTTDFASKEKLANLLRYESSLTEVGKTTSLADYVSRMPEEQKEIYYLHAPTRAQLEAGPYLEAFKARNREVLFLFEPIDEFVMNHLTEFEGKKLISADSADLDLGGEVSGEGEPLPEADLNALCTWLKETLKERQVEKVEASNRLVDSPAVALNADKFMTPAMRRILKASGRDDEARGTPRVNLGINPRHPLIKKLASLHTTDADLATMVAEQIHDNALVAAGYVEDPRTMVDRIYKLMERL